MKRKGGSATIEDQENTAGVLTERAIDVWRGERWRCDMNYVRIKEGRNHGPELP